MGEAKVVDIRDLKDVQVAWKDRTTFCFSPCDLKVLK
jgi:hypothetical protein